MVTVCFGLELSDTTSEVEPAETPVIVTVLELIATVAIAVDGWVVMVYGVTPPVIDTDVFPPV
jgi:hypothetical protein